MSLLKRIFGSKKPIESNKDLVVSEKVVLPETKGFIVHPDIHNLLWIVDGPKRNYILEEKEQNVDYGGVRFSFSSYSSLEPSLISINLPVLENVSKENIERPPYYPSYAGLSAAQRNLYWEMLKNPYNGQADIGYVFILYYGLERHLIEGEFEDAYNVILKLRDVYENASFQYYSACALILTCLIRQRADLAYKFYISLDKDFKLDFSDNLYLLCKMGLGLHLTAQDIMRMAKTFEFANQYYIKKYPELFLKNLSVLMEEDLGKDSLEISKYITSDKFQKLHKQAVPIFANLSIRDQTVDVPLISESFKFKKTANNLLQQAHEKVKKDLANMRKEGFVPLEKKAKRKKELPTFDQKKEEELLQQYNDIDGNIISKHFALIALQKFYYKYREVNGVYLNKCIDYCYEDIQLLPQLQSQYIEEEKKRILMLSSLYSKQELEEKLSAIHAFQGDIPAFKRLAIIYEKSKNYSKAINICNQAIAYYLNIDMNESVREFEKRKKKIEGKI